VKQNAHLAKYADGDESDDEYFGAEPAQLLGRSCQAMIDG